MKKEKKKEKENYSSYDSLHFWRHTMCACDEHTDIIHWKSMQSCMASLVTIDFQDTEKKWEILQ